MAHVLSQGGQFADIPAIAGPPAPGGMAVDPNVARAWFMHHHARPALPMPPEEVWERAYADHLHATMGATKVWCNGKLIAEYSAPPRGEG